MTVLPATRQIQLTPRYDSPTNAPEPPEHVPSFGEVLAAALQAKVPAEVGKRGGESAQPAVEGSLARSAGLGAVPDDPVRVEIGEDAVRFDARPVVGGSVAPVAALETRPESAPPISRADGEIVELQPDLQQALATTARRIEAKLAGQASWIVSGPSPSRLSGSAAKSAAASAGEMHIPLRAALPLLEGLPAAARARAPEGSKPEVRTNISLALVGDEILVTVRGLDLTAEEEEALLGEMGSLLSSSELGARTLRLVTLRRA